MNMKKTAVLLVSMSSVVLLLSVSLFVTTFNQVSRASDTSVSETVTYQYVVKEHNGKIGIFSPGSAEPGQVLDIDTSGLPELDRLALEQGIEIRSDAELRRLIEDFDG